MTERIEPQTVEDAAAALREASAAGQLVRFRGGETKRAWGASGAEPSVVIATGALNRVLEHNTGDLTAVLEAGGTARARRARCELGRRARRATGAGKRRGAGQARRARGGADARRRARADPPGRRRRATVGEAARRSALLCQGTRANRGEAKP